MRTLAEPPIVPNELATRLGQPAVTATGEARGPALGTSFPVVVVDAPFDAVQTLSVYSAEVASRTHVVLRGRGCGCHQFPGTGQASISAVVRGEGTWATEYQRYVLRPGVRLVLDEGDLDVLTIDAPAPLETFCVLFRTGFLRELAFELQLDLAVALDGPEGVAAEEPRVFAGIHPNADSVGAAMEQLRSCVMARASAFELEQEFFAAGCALLRTDAEFRSRSARVTATRASTRLEILKRVSRGRDYIESHLSGHFRLRDIARAAAMSAFHFHRSFVEVFGETPHDYTTRRRLAVAKHLLASSDLPIGDVAFAAGFGGPTSFSAVFRRHEACSPSAFRLMRRGVRPHRSIRAGVRDCELPRW